MTSIYIILPALPLLLSLFIFFRVIASFSPAQPFTYIHINATSMSAGTMGPLEATVWPNPYNEIAQPLLQPPFMWIGPCV